MSSSVDERIVKLGFDNGKFEKGVSQSMSTLDKLEEKLKFKHAEEGTKNIQRAFDGFDFSVMSRGIESLERRFSTMGIAGMNVVNKITDSIIGAAKRIEAATIGQIKAGGWSRAMNLANAQFQIEGLGEDWNEMQKAISYGVKDTAYGLDAAASAASSLVASGVAYKESIEGANDSLMHTSLRAISGVAAMTNSSYEDISRIFTTVAGNGRLMGDQLLQLSSRGLNVAANLANAFGKTESEIRDMVSHGQIDFKTFATAMDDAFGAHAKEANKTFTGAFSNMKAALSRFGAVFATPVIEKTNTLFISLTSRIDELKGKLGDVKDEEGKIVKVGLGTHFAEMWQSGIDAFSALIKAIDLSWFDKVVEKVDNVTVGIKGFFDTLKEYLTDSTEEAAEGIGDATKTMLVSAEEAKAARDIIDKGLYGSGQRRVDALTELFGGGEDGAKHAANVQAYINAVAAAGWNYEKSAIKVAEANKTAAESEEELAAQIKKAKIKDLLAKTKKVLSDMWKITTNVAKAAKKVASAILTAFGNIFKMDVTSITDGISSFSDMLVKLSEKLIISDETANKVTKVFEFFFSVVRKGISVLVNAGKGAKDFFKEFKDTQLFNKLSDGFQNFASKTQNSRVFKWISEKIKGLLDTTNDYDFFANLKNKFIDFSNNVDIAGFFGGIKESIADAFESISKIKMPAGFSDTGVLSAITTFFGGIGDLLKGESDLPEKLKKFFVSLGEAFKSIDWDAIAHNATTIGAVLIIYKVVKLLDSMRSMVDAVTSLPGKLASVFSGITAAFSSVGAAIGKLSNAAVIKMIAASILDVAIVIAALAAIPEQDLYRGLSVVVVIAIIIKALSKASDSLVKNGVKLTAKFGTLVKINGGMIGIGLVIFGIAAVIASISLLAKTLDSLEDPTAVFKTIGTILISIAILIVGIGGALAGIAAWMKDFDQKLVKLIPIAVSIAIVMGVFSAALIGIAAAMLLLSLIPAEKLDAVTQTFTLIESVFFGFMAFMVILIGVVSKYLQLNVGPILAVSVMMIAFTAAITNLIGAIALMALLFKAEDKGLMDTYSGFLAVAFLIMVIGVAMTMMIGALGAVAKGGNLKGVSTAMVALAAVIAVISYSIAKLAENVDPNTSKIALSIAVIIAAIGAAFAAIFLAMGSFGKKTGNTDPSKVLLSIAAAFLVISISVYIFAEAMQKLLQRFSETSGALVTVGAFLAILIAFVVVIGVINAFMPDATGAMLAIGVSFALIGVGAFLVAEAINVLVSALAKLAPNLESVFLTLEAHKPTAVLFGVFILAIIAGIVIAIINLAKIIVPIVQTIAQALQTVLQVFSNFGKKSEQTSDHISKSLSTKTKTAIVGIIGGLLAAMISMTPEMLDTLGMIIIKVLTWLGNIAGDVAEGLVEFIIRVVNGVADSIRLNSARIANALWNVVYAIFSLVINLIRGIPVLGDLLDGWLSDADKGLNEYADIKRKEAEELDEAKRREHNAYLGIIDDASKADKATKMSLIDMGKSFLGLGAASSDTADSVELDFDSIAKSSGRTRDQVVYDLSAEKQALEEFNNSIYANVAGLDPSTVAKSINANKALLKKSGTASGEAFGSGFSSSMPDINGQISQYFDTNDMSEFGSTGGMALGDSFTETATSSMYAPDDYREVTGENMTAVTDTIDEHKDEVQESTKTSINDTINNTIHDNRPELERETRYMWRGYFDAMESERGPVLKSMAEMVAEIKKTMTGPDGLDEHSPSKVAYGWGKYLVMGLSDGVRNSTSLATDSAAELSDAMIVSFGAPLDYLAKIASGELVYDPSIRPVIDSSAIRSGAGTINSMIGAQQIQLSGYSGQLAADISQLDNSNLRVVEELQLLREDMADMTEQITNMQMVMDTGALVGQISGPIDRSLGRNAVRRGRGN